MSVEFIYKIFALVSNLKSKLESDTIYLPQIKYFLKQGTITYEACAVWREKKKPCVNLQDILDLILGLFLLLDKTG